MFPFSEAGEEGTLRFTEAVATLPGEVALCRLCTAVVNHSRQKQSGLSRMRDGLDDSGFDTVDTHRQDGVFVDSTEALTLYVIHCEILLRVEP